MTATEREVKLAASLYECRDSMRVWWGDAYAERIKERRKLIEAQMADDKSESVLDAALTIAKTMPGGVSVMMVLAAAVEMIEPSEGEPDG